MNLPINNNVEFCIIIKTITIKEIKIIEIIQPLFQENHLKIQSKIPPNGYNELTNYCMNFLMN